MSKNSVLITGNMLSRQVYGGVSRYVIELATGINRDDRWDVKIASPLYVNRYLRDNVRSIGHRGIFFRRRPVALERLNSFLMWTLGRRRYNCDLVHETFFNARNLALASNARVSTFYDMITERFQTNPDYMERKRATAKLSDRIVAISESTKSDLQYYLEVPSEKIEVIYLASDLTVSTGARAVPDDRPFVLWVGNRSGYKNFDALIRAFAKAKIREAGFRIVCAGGPTLSSDEQELINDVGISRDRILHVAPTEDQLAALYRDAEMLVYVSKYEGFGLPPLEAMRCDCPVIASNTGSIPEITGDAALSVAPSDIDALSAGMDRLAEEPSLKEQLVKRGRRRCSQFSWQRCVTEHLSLYRSLL